MRDKNFKEIVINMGLFALIFSFSLWMGQLLHPFLPSLAILLLAHLSLELANGLDRKFRIPLYILALIAYPLAFDFFRHFLQASFLNGLVLFVLYLYFLRLFLSYHRALFHFGQGKYQKHLANLLSSLSFACLASLLRIDQNSLYKLVQSLSPAFIKAQVGAFSPENFLFFLLLHLVFLYLVEIFFARLLAKK